MFDADHTRTTSRRAMLRVALAGATSTLPAACGGGATAPSPPAPAAALTAAPKPAATSAANAAAAAPTMASTSAAANADGVIPSPAQDVPDAYLKLPPSFKSVTAVPGKGGTVTAAFISYSAPVPPRDQNQYWQELEKRMGITYEPNYLH